MAANGLFFTDASKETMQWLTSDSLQTVSRDAGPNAVVMLWGVVLSLVLSFGLGWQMK